jgi:hypothetical protein
MEGANFNMTITKGPNVLTIGSKNCNNAIQIYNKNTAKERFAVHWDGSVFLRGEATLTVESGKIISGNKVDDLPYYELTPTGGRIGPWYITNDAIYAGAATVADATSILKPDGNIILKAAGFKLSLTQSEFFIGKYGADKNVSGYSDFFPRIVFSDSGFSLVDSIMSSNSSVPLSIKSGSLSFPQDSQYASQPAIALTVNTSSIKIGSQSIEIKTGRGNLYTGSLRASLSSSFLTSVVLRESYAGLIAGTHRLRIYKDNNEDEVAAGFYIDEEGPGVSETIVIKTYQADKDGFLTDGYVSKSYKFVNGILIDVT